MRLRWEAINAELPPSAGKRIGRSVWLHASALSPRLRADLAGVHAQPHDVPAEDLVLRIDHAERRVACGRKMVFGVVAPVSSST